MKNMVAEECARRKLFVCEQEADHRERGLISKRGPASPLSSVLSGLLSDFLVWPTQYRSYSLSDSLLAANNH